MSRLARHFPHDLIPKLAGRASNSAISTTVDYLVPACSASSSPIKSLHAYLRFLRQHRVSDVTLTTIRGAVQEKLPHREPPIGSVEWVAKVRGVSARSIKQKLHTVGGRRLYGWPMWTGHAWDIPVAAVEPSTRGAFLQAMPAEEPEAQRRSLPAWCEREVRSEGVKA